MTSDGWSNFVVILFCVTNVVELACGCKHGTTEPYGITLHVVRNDVHSQRNSLNLATAELLASLDTSIDGSLNISLKSLSEILEPGRTTKQNNVLIESTTGIDGAALNGVIDDLGEGSQEVAAVNFGVEENLGTEETFVTNIDGEWLLCDGFDGSVLLNPLVSSLIVLLELLSHVRADVAVCFLDGLSNIEGLSGGNAFALSHQL